jgi:hypothetical protein
VGILPDLQNSRMRTDAELQPVAVNVQALINYASENPAASVVILDTHFPDYRIPAAHEGFAIARTVPIPRIRYKNPSLAIVGRPPY